MSDSLLGDQITFNINRTDGNNPPKDITKDNTCTFDLLFTDANQAAFAFPGQATNIRGGISFLSYVNSFENINGDDKGPGIGNNTFAFQAPGLSGPYPASDIYANADLTNRPVNALHRAALNARISTEVLRNVNDYWNPDLELRKTAQEVLGEDTEVTGFSAELKDTYKNLYAVQHEPDWDGTYYIIENNVMRPNPDVYTYEDYLARSEIFFASIPDGNYDGITVADAVNAAIKDTLQFRYEQALQSRDRIDIQFVRHACQYLYDFEAPRQMCLHGMKCDPTVGALKNDTAITYYTDKLNYVGEVVMHLSRVDISQIMYDYGMGGDNYIVNEQKYYVEKAATESGSEIYRMVDDDDNQVIQLMQYTEVENWLTPERVKWMLCSKRLGIKESDTDDTVLGRLQNDMYLVHSSDAISVELRPLANTRDTRGETGTRYDAGAAANQSFEVQETFEEYDGSTYYKPTYNDSDTLKTSMSFPLNKKSENFTAANIHVPGDFDVIIRVKIDTHLGLKPTSITHNWNGYDIANKNIEGVSEDTPWVQNEPVKTTSETDTADSLRNNTTHATKSLIDSMKFSDYITNVMESMQNLFSQYPLVEMTAKSLANAQLKKLIEYMSDDNGIPLGYSNCTYDVHGKNFIAPFNNTGDIAPTSGFVNLDTTTLFASQFYVTPFLIDKSKFFDSSTFGTATRNFTTAMQSYRDMVNDIITTDSTTRNYTPNPDESDFDLDNVLLITSNCDHLPYKKSTDTDDENDIFSQHPPMQNGKYTTGEYESAIQSTQPDMYYTGNWQADTYHRDSHWFVTDETTASTKTCYLQSLQQRFRIWRDTARNSDVTINFGEIPAGNFGQGSDFLYKDFDSKVNNLGYFKIDYNDEFTRPAKLEPGMLALSNSFEDDNNYNDRTCGVLIAAINDEYCILVTSMFDGDAEGLDTIDMWYFLYGHTLTFVNYENLQTQFHALLSMLCMPKAFSQKQRYRFGTIPYGPDPSVLPANAQTNTLAWTLARNIENDFGIKLGYDRPGGFNDDMTEQSYTNDSLTNTISQHTHSTGQSYYTDILWSNHVDNGFMKPVDIQNAILETGITPASPYGTSQDLSAYYLSFFDYGRFTNPEFDDMTQFEFTPGNFRTAYTGSFYMCMDTFLTNKNNDSEDIMNTCCTICKMENDNDSGTQKTINWTPYEVKTMVTSTFYETIIYEHTFKEYITQAVGFAFLQAQIGLQYQFLNPQYNTQYTYGTFTYTDAVLDITEKALKNIKPMKEDSVAGFSPVSYFTLTDSILETSSNNFMMIDIEEYDEYRTLQVDPSEDADDYAVTLTAADPTKAVSTSYLQIQEQDEVKILSPTESVLKMQDITFTTSQMPTSVDSVFGAGLAFNENGIQNYKLGAGHTFKFEDINNAYREFSVANKDAIAALEFTEYTTLSNDEKKLVDAFVQITQDSDGNITNIGGYIGYILEAMKQLLHMSTLFNGVSSITLDMMYNGMMYPTALYYFALNDQGTAAIGTSNDLVLMNRMDLDTLIKIIFNSNFSLNPTVFLNGCKLVDEFNQPLADTDTPIFQSPVLTAHANLVATNINHENWVITGSALTKDGCMGNSDSREIVCNVIDTALVKQRYDTYMDKFRQCERALRWMCRANYRILNPTIIQSYSALTDTTDTDDAPISDIQSDPRLFPTMSYDMPVLGKLLSFDGNSNQVLRKNPSFNIDTDLQFTYNFNMTSPQFAEFCNDGIAMIVQNSSSDVGGYDITVCPPFVMWFVNPVANPTEDTVLSDYALAQRYGPLDTDGATVTMTLEPGFGDLAHFLGIDCSTDSGIHFLASAPCLPDTNILQPSSAIGHYRAIGGMYDNTQYHYDKVLGKLVAIKNAADTDKMAKYEFVTHDTMNSFAKTQLSYFDTLQQRFRNIEDNSYFDRHVNEKSVIYISNSVNQGRTKAYPEDFNQGVTYFGMQAMGEQPVPYAFDYKTLQTPYWRTARDGAYKPYEAPFKNCSGYMCIQDTEDEHVRKLQLQIHEPVKIYMFHVRTPVRTDAKGSNMLVDDFGGMGGSSQTMNRYGETVEYQTMADRYDDANVNGSGSEAEYYPINRNALQYDSYLGKHVYNSMRTTNLYKKDGTYTTGTYNDADTTQSIAYPAGPQQPCFHTSNCSPIAGFNEDDEHDFREQHEGNANAESFVQHPFHAGMFCRTGSIYNGWKCEGAAPLRLGDRSDKWGFYGVPECTVVYSKTFMPDTTDILTLDTNHTFYLFDFYKSTNKFRYNLPMQLSTRKTYGTIGNVIDQLGIPRQYLKTQYAGKPAFVDMHKTILINCDLFDGGAIGTSGYLGSNAIYSFNPLIIPAGSSDSPSIDNIIYYPCKIHSGKSGGNSDITNFKITLTSLAYHDENGQPMIVKSNDLFSLNLTLIYNAPPRE